jgi:hypothetical protein
MFTSTIQRSFRLLSSGNDGFVPDKEGDGDDEEENVVIEIPVEQDFEETAKEFGVDGIVDGVEKENAIAVHVPNVQRLKLDMMKFLDQGKVIDAWTCFLQIPEDFRTIEIYRLALDSCKQKPGIQERATIVLNSLRGRFEHSLNIADMHQFLKAFSRYVEKEDMVLDLMKKLGIQFTEETFLLLFQSCMKSGSATCAERSLQILDMSKLFKVEFSTSVYNLVIHLCSESSKHQTHASEVLQYMIEKQIPFDAQTYICIMQQSFQKHKKYKDVIEAYEDMKLNNIKPLSQNLQIVLWSHVALKSNISVAESLLEDIKKFGMNLDSKLYKPLLSLGSSPDALKTFEAIKLWGFSLSADLYNFLLEQFCSPFTGNLAKADALYSEMKLGGVKPNHSTFELLISGHATSHDSESKIKDLLREMDEFGIAPKHFLRSIKKSYQDLDSLERKIKEPKFKLSSRALWSVIHTCSKYNLNNKLMRFIELAFEHQKFRQSWIDDIVCFLAEEADKEILFRFVELVWSNGKSVSANSLVTAMRDLDYDSSTKLFGKIRSKGIVDAELYKAAIISHLANDDPVIIRELLDEMDEKNIWLKTPKLSDDSENAREDDSEFNSLILDCLRKSESGNEST